MERILDARTLLLRLHGTLEPIRLAHVITPPIGTRAGAAATTLLAALTRDKSIHLIPTGSTPGGTRLAHVLAPHPSGTWRLHQQPHKHVGETLASCGLALSSEHAPGDPLTSAIHAAETRARNARTGIWRRTPR